MKHSDTISLKNKTKNLAVLFFFFLQINHNDDFTIPLFVSDAPSALYKVLDIKKNKYGIVSGCHTPNAIGKSPQNENIKVTNQQKY